MRRRPRAWWATHRVKPNRASIATTTELSVMYNSLRTLLFHLDAETSHDLSLAVLRTTARSPILCRLLNRLTSSRLAHALPPTVAMGLSFPNPLGLAAGFDKHAVAGNALGALGFGFVEFGTVTPQPQPGNPRPRLFRLPQQQAMINRFGFNSVGLARFNANMNANTTRERAHFIKGVNISKNSATPLDQSIVDYVTALHSVYAVADYVALNISSPNSENLRALQQDERLSPLLATLHNERKKLAEQHGRWLPLVVKIAPDLTRAQLIGIAHLVQKHQINGIIATNSTIARPKVQTDPLARQPGGLSGRPLRAMATETIAILRDHLPAEVTIIGVGGIDDGTTALEKLHAGAQLIQIYTGLIYQGPRLISDILTTLVAQHSRLSVGTRGLGSIG